MSSSNACWRCIYRIPIFGGMCAPNESPEKTCYKHFSNEMTVPQPCLRSGRFRSCAEHSTPIRMLGRFGLPVCGRYRKIVMTISFLISFAAWIMLMYAAFALNPNRELTTNTAWLKWKVDGGTTKGWLGLDTLVFRNEVFGVWETKRIENICDEDRVEVSVGEEGATAVITDADQLFGKSCESCQRHTVTSVQLIIMACITQIFQMCTALQRSTRYGDLNCQKLFGVSTSIFGFASTLSSLNLFRRACGLSSFFAPWTKQKTLDILIFGPNDDEGVYTPTRFNIRSGLAFTLLYVATVLKLIDVFFHLVTPTPSQKNHPYPHPEKLTLEEYMHIVVEDQPDTYKNSHNLPQKLDDDDDENASVGRVQSEAST